MSAQLRAAFVIPALDAERSLGAVLDELNQTLAERELPAPHPKVVVVDDGSRDGTAAIARERGALVLTHAKNQGKGAALQTALHWAREEGIEVLVSLDADGQHPPREAVRLLLLDAPSESFVIGVRDLAGAGAPRPNQHSNRFSNQVLSLFSGRSLLDTQSGLRRYPVRATLELGARDPGFAFEADVLLRAARRGRAIVHEPCAVLYPPGDERVTHFDSVRDPARIVRRVLSTTLLVPHHKWYRRWGKRLLGFGLACSISLTLLHLFVQSVGRLEPPELTFERAPLREEEGVRHVGKNSALRRNGIWEVHLQGSPEEIGWAHSRLLYPQMRENEAILNDAFVTSVPSPFFRRVLLDWAVWGFRHLPRGMDQERLRELGAQALGFSPDPFSHNFPTFQRFVYLASLYDISLSFEHSPLVGCTSFTLAPEWTEEGAPLLGRVFDFEVDDVFDEQKAIFFVQERGKIPFASVAWPGLLGVVSGMNAEGLAVVVHGARAGKTLTQGEPVVHALRRVLAHAKSTEEAIALLAESTPLVSHLVVLTDARGDARALERIPEEPLHARALPGRATVTNHLEGPFAEDPKNLRVRQTTSTLARRARGDALIRETPTPIGVPRLLSWLRDQKDASGAPLPPRDRRAINAEIATHGVIMNTKERELWVSQSPHLDGAFFRYDLRRFLATDAPADPAQNLESLPRVESAH